MGRGEMMDLVSGRGLVWAGRALVWAVIVVVGVTGVRGLFVTPGSAQQVDVEPQVTFPERAGSALAGQVAVEYLSWGQGEDSEHPEHLRPLMSAAGAPTGAATTQQQVLHVMPASLDVHSSTAATATVSAHVLRSAGDAATPEWLHLQVPLRVTDDGAVAADGLPAFVGGEEFAAGEPGEPPPVGDPAVAAALTEPLSAFFRAFAAGDTAELGYLTTSDAAITGLSGAVEFDGLERTAVVDAEGDVGTAIADVRWRAGDAVVHQPYRLRVVREGDRWYVAGLTAHAGTPREHAESTYPDNAAER